MLFNSPLFLFFFLPATLTVYLILPVALRNVFLLFCSLAFYFLADRSYVLVLLLSIIVNFGLSLLMGGFGKGTIPGSRRRRLALFAALAFNLGLLLYWKFGRFLFLSITHGAVQVRTLHLPLGISFFTFAVLSYFLDLYQKRTEAERSPVRFALYLALFPKMTAGPIVRYRDLTLSLRSRPATLDGLSSGVERFLVGLGKKVLIANAVAPVADEIFRLPLAALTPALAWLGAFCYAIQIYFDFSGYSDMAIGLGRMFGFDFLENFNYPYMAGSIRDFWQRWHISLSTWFRDYLFLPLAFGISRKLTEDRWLGMRAEMLAYAPSMLTTMALCGLWHGTGWTFVLWGLWHGLFLVLENSRVGKRMLKKAPSPLRHVLTQGIVLIGWVIFRSQSLSQIGTFLLAMAGVGWAGRVGPESVFAADYLNRNVSGALVLGVLFSFPVSRLLRHWRERGVSRLPVSCVPAIEGLISTGVTAVLLALLVLCAMSVAGGTYNPFVYRQF